MFMYFPCEIHPSGVSMPFSETEMFFFPVFQGLTQSAFPAQGSTWGEPVTLAEPLRKPENYLYIYI